MSSDSPQPAYLLRLMLLLLPPPTLPDEQRERMIAPADAILVIIRREMMRCARKQAERDAHFYRKRQ